jgi:hypothetical protein
MRTKTLLIATAAALAAGIISSQAQVYSQNIVGYVNNPFNSGYSSQANPLDNGAGNSLTNLINNTGGTYDGTFVYVWGGNSYTIYQFDSSQSTGIANANDSAALPSPSLPPGISWFVNNAAASNNITYVGTVSVDAPPTGSQVVGTSTNVISGSHAYTLAGSRIPVGGGISSVLQLTNTAGALDGTFIYVPNISANGTFLGYSISQFDSSQSTGFANANDSASVPEPQIKVASGFFINNQSGGPITWVQKY